jgi:hypothetical protein
MTVGELDTRMTYAERQNWLRYVKENGPLNPLLRMEAAIGRAVLPFLKKGARLQDLMPWPRAVDVEGTPEAVGHALMAAFAAGGGNGKKAKYKVRKHGR